MLLDSWEEEGDDLFNSFQTLIGNDDTSIVPTFQDFADCGSVDSSPPKASSKQSEKTNKKRKCNPDADAIAAVTEESMKALNIDMDSKDAKKMRRQIRNRLSAQYHRDRKNAHIKDLETAVEEKSKMIQQLEEELLKLKAENTRLSALLAQSQPTPSLLDLLAPSQPSLVNSAPAVPSAGGAAASLSGTDNESLSGSENGSTPLHSATTSPFHFPSDGGFIYSEEWDNQLVQSAALVQRDISYSNSIPSVSQMPVLPIPRALGFMAVLAVLAVCCLGNLPFPPMVSQPMVQSSSGQPLSSVSRRLMTIDPPDTLPTPVTATPVSHKKESTALGDPDLTKSSVLLANNQTIINAKNTKNNLRHFPAASSSNQTDSAENGIQRSDLVPFGQVSTQYWQPSRVNYKPTSFSRIIVKNGLTLLDPSMSHQANAWQPIYLSSGGSSNNDMKSTDDLPVVPPVVLPVEKNNVPSEKKHWPAVAGVGGALVASGNGPVQGSAGHDGNDHCNLEKLNSLQGLLGHLNEISITVPVSSIRSGTSVEGSQAESIEQLLHLLNLSAPKSEPGNSTSNGVFSNSPNAVVEFHCILLGAKLNVLESATA